MKKVIICKSQGKWSDGQFTYFLFASYEKVEEHGVRVEVSWT